MPDRLRLRDDKGRLRSNAANRQYVVQAQKREDDLAAMIRSDPKGPVQCQGWIDDPDANAKPFCVSSANMCTVNWPGASPPRLKPPN